MYSFEETLNRSFQESRGGRLTLVQHAHQHRALHHAIGRNRAALLPRRYSNANFFVTALRSLNVSHMDKTYRR